MSTAHGDAYKVRIASIAAELTRYLKSHPGAADTLIGVATWWLKQQRIEEHLELVEKALESLAIDKEIEKSINQDGAVIYRITDDRDEL